MSRITSTRRSSTRSATTRIDRRWGAIQGQTDLTTCTTPGRPGDTFVTKGFFTPAS
jgi:hypothetical protein